VAYDLHPEYLATKYALGLPGPKIGVQHHYAHMVSCLAENGEEGPAIGLSFDGLGYGTDGHLWGGEFLLGDVRSFSRAAHLEYVPMPGGAAAIRHPWRMAVGYLYTLLGEEGLRRYHSLFPGGMEDKIEIIRQQLAKKINSPLTSSCGRLFDGIAALLRLGDTVSYEGQAASALEMIADPQEDRRYDFFLQEEGGEEIIRLGPFITGVVQDISKGLAPSVIAGKFHSTLVAIGVTVSQKIRGKGGPKSITLSGGVFQNRLLAERMKAALENAGFQVWVHRQVPCNDGGLSLGQAVAAHFISS
jgi:hydrogenase maturation protein HypF